MPLVNQNQNGLLKLLLVLPCIVSVNQGNTVTDGQIVHNDAQYG